MKRLWKNLWIVEEDGTKRLCDVVYAAVTALLVAAAVICLFLLDCGEILFMGFSLVMFLCTLLWSNGVTG